MLTAITCQRRRTVFFLLIKAKEELNLNIKGRGANRKDLGGALRGWDYDDYNENNIKLKQYASKFKAQNSKFRGNNTINYNSNGNFSKFHEKRELKRKSEKEVE